MIYIIKKIGNTFRKCLKTVDSYKTVQQVSKNTLKRKLKPEVYRIFSL